jgi:hypothetical protein
MGRAGGHIDETGLIGSPGRATELAEIFGDIISTYTREEAIMDGVLVDPEVHMPGMAKESGFVFPIAFTSSVWNDYILPDSELIREGQSLDGRLWDTLHMLRYAIKQASKNESDIPFSVWYSLTGDEAQYNSDGERTPVEISLKAVCGPADDGSPCLTIMLPSED